MRNRHRALFSFAFPALLLSGCAGLPTENNAHQANALEPAALPTGLPSDAAIGIPEEQRILMRRDLYRATNGDLQPLTAIDQAKLSAPRTAQSNNKRSTDAETTSEKPDLKPVTLILKDIQKPTHD